MENPGTSPKAISFHYDRGNEFYKLWLDKTMSYSCGMWEENETYDSLLKAQFRKLDYHVRQARAGGADCILDIGCGWGALINRVVEVHGCKKAIGLTLSKEQAYYISSMNKPKIEVRVESWSEHNPTILYDSIFSIGSFEHFSRPDRSTQEKINGYRAFFQRCHDWLKPGGWMSLQTIALGNMLRDDFHSFITNSIFPESDAPRLFEIAEASERIFEIVQLRNDRADYALTCRAWLRNLKANRKEVIRLVGEEITRRYEKYFQHCVFGFEMGANDLFRITFRRIDHPKQ